MACNSSFDFFLSVFANSETVYCSGTRCGTKKARCLIPGSCYHLLSQLDPRLPFAFIARINPADNGAKMSSECSQNVAKMRPEYSQNIAKILPKCTQNVARIWPKCSQNVAKIQAKCSQNIARMQMKCSQNVARIQQKCN